MIVIETFKHNVTYNKKAERDLSALSFLNPRYECN